MLAQISQTGSGPVEKKMLTPGKVTGAVLGAAGGGCLGYLASSSLLTSVSIPHADNTFVMAAFTVGFAAAGLHFGYQLAAHR